MILAGVALGSLFSAETTLMEYFADDVRVAAVVYWTFGDLGSTFWKDICVMGAVVLAASVYFACNCWNYNAMQGGEDGAKGLGVEKGEHSLYCIAESRACYMDGIQSVFGTTWGGGNLELRDRGKTAFNFYDRTTGKSLRLVSKDWPSGLEKSEMIEFLLNEPLGNVFSVTETHFEAPDDSFVRQSSQPCAVCGEMCREPFLRVSAGRLVCLDCAEKKLNR